MAERGALARVLGFALACALGAVCAGDALAQAKKKDEKRSAPTIDATTGKKLNAALEALNAEKYKEAAAILDGMNMSRLSPYEASRVEQIQASIAHAQGNFNKARGHLEKSVAAGGLNDDEQKGVRFQIAQLYLAEERWQDGVNALKQWFATADKPNSQAYYMLAVAYYQLNDYKNALEPATKAIELSDKPQESWLQLLLALRMQRDEYKLALPILRRLVAVAPDKKSYWVQLSAVNAQLGDYEGAVVPLQIAYNAGMLTEEAELKRLTDLLLHVGIPYRGAQILTKALEQKKIKSGPKIEETLGNCYIAARDYDKAIRPMERAAELSESGDLFVRLGEVHVQREDWKAAASALRKAIDKGRLKNPGNANLLMGIAVYSAKDPKGSVQWFQRARQHEKVRQQADAWLKSIDEGV